MATELRRLGFNIEKASREMGDSTDDFAAKIGFSVRDTQRLFEGRLILSPVELKRISKLINKPLSELLNVNGSYSFVGCMGKFKNKKSEDKILDIIDNYIDLVEAIS